MIMRFTIPLNCLVFLSILVISPVRSEWEEEDGVMVLTDKTFTKALDENTFLLVNFYAPWSGHCKELAPKFAAAAKFLASKNSEIKLAKVDLTSHPNVARRYGVVDKVPPIIKFFRSMQPIDYKGEKSVEAIINWVEKKTLPALTQLPELNDVKKFIEDYEISIIGLFRDQRSWAVSNLVAVAENLDGFGFEFGITSNKDVFDTYEVKNDDIMMYRAFDGARFDFKGKRGWNVEEVTNFIISNSMPLLVEFSPEFAPRVLSSDKGTVYFITSSKAPEFFNLKEVAGNIAKDWKNKLTVVLVDIEVEGNRDFIPRLGVKEEDLPTVRFAYSLHQKYSPPTNDLSEVKIRSFITEVQSGRIQPNQYTKSQEIPEDWNKGPVKILVGKNFHDVVTGNKKTFVFFYTPDCQTCLDIQPICEQLGEDFRDRHEIQIAKMDCSENEVDLVEVTSFPTVLFFQNNVKRQVLFNDEHTEEGYLRWLERKGIVRPRRVRDEL